MLHGENGCGHQHGHLFAIGCRFESRPYGHFRLTETHISAHQAIHGVALLHVAFYIFGGFGLIGGIFVDKGRLQFGLQEAVGAEGKTGCCFSLGVQRNQLFGNVLYFLFDLVLLALPLTGPQLADQRWCTFPARVA